MIAADTSAWIDYAKGNMTPAAQELLLALERGLLVIPPIVYVEIMSGPKITPTAEKFIQALPRLDLKPGYWERAAIMRRTILKKGLKARLGDCLIAQSCIDMDVELITGDSDFRHFTKFGLKLLT